MVHVLKIVISNGFTFNAFVRPNNSFPVRGVGIREEPSLDFIILFLCSFYLYVLFICSKKIMQINQINQCFNYKYRFFSNAPHFMGNGL